jgi:diguanylate cyclase
MAVAEWVIRKAPVQSRLFYWVTRGSVALDIVAFLALALLTGGSYSPLFPIAYLIIIHAAVYWGYKGGLSAAFILAIGYSSIVKWGPEVQLNSQLLLAALKILFLLVIGFVGGFIVARERKHMMEKSSFESMARLDYLTGVANHRSFQEQMIEWTQSDRPFVLAMGDIDYFKNINDNYGHLTGDQVLQAIGGLLEQSFPRSRGIPFRYGGEEFGLLLNTDQLETAVSWLEEFKSALSSMNFRVNDQQFHVTMSFGAVVVVGGQPSYWISKADQLLYQAKCQGRNQVAFKTI